MVYKNLFVVNLDINLLIILLVKAILKYTYFQ